MSEDSKSASVALERAEASVVSVEDYGLAPKNLDEQLRMAKWALESGLLPEAIKTTAAAWLVMERGAELGFKGLAAFDFLYAVNGRVRITPDGVKAKALASGLLEDAREETSGDGEAMLARVTVKRRGLPSPVVAEFSMYDARLAGLLHKDNWKKYPKRMLLARARGFAYGDAFKDLTGGLPVREFFDLEPGETLGEAPMGRKAEMPPLPPATPDPLIAELTAPKPAGPAEMASHSEKEIPLATKDCAHTGIQTALGKSGGRAVVCHECGEEVRPKAEDWPVAEDAHAKHGIAPADPAAVPDADFSKPPSAQKKGRLF